jgi:hypothetical protein
MSQKHEPQRLAISRLLYQNKNKQKKANGL